MVRLATPLVLLTSIIVSTFAVPLASRDIPTVKSDIQSIKTAVIALDNSINKFPDSGGSLADALVRFVSHRVLISPHLNPALYRIIGPGRQLIRRLKS